MRVEPLTEKTLEGWAALFDACAQPCHCRYWHFGGNKNEWLARCAFEPEKNRAEQEALVRADAPEGRGLVAVENDQVVGWMKLAPRARLAKLRNQGAYRSLDLGPDDGVWSIGCFLVHPEWRRRGVARALVLAAETHARAWGARAIEAYPRHADHELPDEQAWTGPESIFLACGFARVAGEEPYPVYRREIDRET